MQKKKIDRSGKHNPMYGKTQSENARNAISQTQKKRWDMIRQITSNHNRTYDEAVEDEVNDIMLSPDAMEILRAELTKFLRNNGMNNK